MLHWDRIKVYNRSIQAANSFRKPVEMDMQERIIKEHNPKFNVCNTHNA